MADEANEFFYLDSDGNKQDAELHGRDPEPGRFSD